jgi:hypothetical protein
VLFLKMVELSAVGRQVIREVAFKRLALTDVQTAL